jgi:hypothetical protein
MTLDEIAKQLPDKNIRSIMGIPREFLPVVFMFEGKYYELRYTFNGGLVLRKYEDELTK